MSMEIWMPVLKAKVRQLDGLKAAYDFSDMPGSLIATPCAVILPEEGETSYGASSPGLNFTVVNISIFTSTQILPVAQAQAVPYIKLIKEKLAANMMLDSLVQHILPATPWFRGPGRLLYGDKEHTGITFRYIVKEIEVVTVTA